MAETDAPLKTDSEASLSSTDTDEGYLSDMEAQGSGVQQKLEKTSKTTVKTKKKNSTGNIESDRSGSPASQDQESVKGSPDKTASSGGASITSASSSSDEGTYTGVIPSPYAFKVVFLGDSAVGKTSTIRRAVRDEFNDAYVCTIGIDFLTYKLEHKNRSFKVHIWDTAAQERFRCIVASYIRGADFVVLMYDVTNPDSLEAIEHWYQEVTTAARELDHTNIFVVGNKIDCAPEERKVTTFDGAATARAYGVGFLEVSAKRGTGIEELRQHISLCAKRGLEKHFVEDEIRAKLNREAGYDPLLLDGRNMMPYTHPALNMFAAGSPYEQEVAEEMFASAGSSGSHWAARGDKKAPGTKSPSWRSRCCS